MEIEKLYQEIKDAQRRMLRDPKWLECPDCGGYHPFRFNGPDLRRFPHPLDFFVVPAPGTCAGFMMKINSEIRRLKNNLGLDIEG